MNSAERGTLQSIACQALALRNLADSILHQCQASLGTDEALKNTPGKPAHPQGAAGDDDLNPRVFHGAPRAAAPQRAEQ